MCVLTQALAGHQAGSQWLYDKEANFFRGDGASAEEEKALRSSGALTWVSLRHRVDS